MPLTKKGKNMLNMFKKHYGRRKGVNVFYATLRKGNLPEDVEYKYYRIKRKRLKR